MNLNGLRPEKDKTFGNRSSPVGSAHDQLPVGAHPILPPCPPSLELVALLLYTEIYLTVPGTIA